MEENPELHEFNYDGLVMQTAFTKKFANRKPYEPPDHRKLTAFIPGTITKVFVKDKDKVKRGEPLLWLQAMKMNNVIIAPFDGVVKKVYVKVGEVVVKQHLLVEMK